MINLYTLSFNYCTAAAQKDVFPWRQQEENSSDQEKLPMDTEFFSITLLMIGKIYRRNIFTMVVSDPVQLKQKSSLPTSQPTHQLTQPKAYRPEAYTALAEQMTPYMSPITQYAYISSLTNVIETRLCLVLGEPDPAHFHPSFPKGTAPTSL